VCVCNYVCVCVPWGRSQLNTAKLNTAFCVFLSTPL
jgi:hypothetical protein